MRLLTSEPHQLFLTSRGGWFYWDAAVDPSRIAELDCQRLKATHADGPARIVVFTFDLGEPLEMWFYVGNGYLGQNFLSTCFDSISDRRLVTRFPDEGLKVLEATIPAGDRILLKP
jgi:hypothetical protein